MPFWTQRDTARMNLKKICGTFLPSKKIHGTFLPSKKSTGLFYLVKQSPGLLYQGFFLLGGGTHIMPNFMSVQRARLGRGGFNQMHAFYCIQNWRFLCLFSPYLSGQVDEFWKRSLEKEDGESRCDHQ